MNASLPLSATSYKTWHDSLRGQRDDISKSKDNFGTDVLSLHTTLDEAVSVGRISDATLVVRAGDWLPTELRFTGLASDGKRVYELTQTAQKLSAWRK
jgi:hypothetical protein